MAKQIPLPKQYPIPANWCWIDMGKVVRMKSGFPFDSSRFSPEAKGKRPLIRIRDVLKGETATYTDEDCPEEYIIHAGEILISMDGDFNVAKWKSEDALLNQRVCCIASDSGFLLDDFLYYYLPDSLKKINDATPSVTVKHLSTRTLNQTPFPLPPLAEQHRIVDRIESLFAKLDEAKEKAQAVVDGFEIRKAAILHKAFAGELTAKWRESHNLSLSSWKEIPWGDFIVSIQAGKNWLAENRPPQPSEFGIVKVSAVTWGEFNEGESKTCTEMTQWNDAIQIYPGDFLFSRANTLQLVGNCVIVNEVTKRLMLSDKILRFKFNDNISAHYVLYYTRSKRYRSQVEALASGNQDGMRNISQKNLKKIVFPVPSHMEQIEIVRILDSLFSKERIVKETAEAVLEQIDTMKKSILVRAFQGGLETNDPTEESAVKLLQPAL